MNMFVDVPGEFTVRKNTQPQQLRRKIWEVDHIFRCPLVGMCLSIAEQRQLCRKVGAPMHAKSDFAAHEMIVATMSGDNPLSRKLENVLARKYEAEHSIYITMPEAEFISIWKARLDEGYFAGLLWTAAVRQLSNAATVEIFGSLHMAMHERAKGYNILKAHSSTMQERVNVLKAKLRDTEKEVRALQTHNEQLQCSLEALRSVQPTSLNNAAHGTACATPETPELMSVPLLELQELTAHLEEVSAALEAEHNEVIELQKKLYASEVERLRLDEEFSAHLAVDAAMRKACTGTECHGEDCSPQCPAYSLCEKRVLIVGGIERMEKAYRRFVEERGGIFEYHAGHMKSGAKTLENSVQRADVVLCPVNCNSHGACLKVKNLGKKYKKTVHMLSNFGLSALSRTMEQIRSTN